MGAWPLQLAHRAPGTTVFGACPHHAEHQLRTPVWHPTLDHTWLAREPWCPVGPRRCPQYGCDPTAARSPSTAQSRSEADCPAACLLGRVADVGLLVASLGSINLNECCHTFCGPNIARSEVATSVSNRFRWIGCDRPSASGKTSSHRFATLRSEVRLRACVDTDVDVFRYPLTANAGMRHQQPSERAIGLTTGSTVQNSPESCLQVFDSP